MIRRIAAASAIAAMLTAFPAIALAQEEATPTTIVTEETTVERDVTLTTTETRELDDDDDDDSDKTGLWGLLGLLGLAGLAGLKKRRDDTTYATGTVRGDTTARGSSTSG